MLRTATTEAKVPKTTFKTIAVNYQRNGVSGAGFYTVRFTDAESGPGEFIATAPSAKMNSDEGVRCYVVNLHNPESCWRGDRFAPAVAKAIRAYNRKMGY